MNTQQDTQIDLSNQGQISEVCHEQLKKELHDILINNFHYNCFRPGQLETILSVAHNRDTIAVMPTGRGKSLCYQIPALHNKKLCLIVSPLISLMRDQVSALTSKNIPSAYLYSGQSYLDKKHIFQNIQNAIKNNTTFLLYVSPERIQNEKFQDWLTQQDLGLIAIDESHCISQWGHDFREDYHKLNCLRSISPQTPIIACTATATPKVVKDIQNALNIVSADIHVYGFYRPNLFYQVEHCEESQKLDYLQNAMAKFKDQKIIVYAGTRKKCEYLYEELLPKYKSVAYYHAGLEQKQRDHIQNLFASDQLKVLIATNAFGMGVDTKDVRCIIHYQLPGTLEAYYQEIGRAGRDGLESSCLLLYSKKDIGLQSYFIQQSSASQKIKNHKWHTLQAMINYAEGSECRHSEILRYFKDKQRIVMCKHCDTCEPKSQRSIRYREMSQKSILRKQAFAKPIKRKTKNSQKSPSSQNNIQFKPLPSKAINVSHFKLSQSLKQWRMQWAKSQDIPAFMVFSNKTLDDIIEKQPISLDELFNVKGLGSHKIKQFGQDIVDIVNQHL